MELTAGAEFGGEADEFMLFEVWKFGCIGGLLVLLLVGTRVRRVFAINTGSSTLAFSSGSSSGSTGSSSSSLLGVVESESDSVTEELSGVKI